MQNQQSSKSVSTRSPWAWIPSLYFAEGLPYVVVMTVSVIMYKRLGISNTDIALYTSWLYLPWVIKPLWSPLVDVLRTKRFWIVIMQLIIGAGLGGVALTIPAPAFFQYTLGFLWLLAFSSATHDIAADGFYMLGLSKHDQAWFVGIRSTFYRLAMIVGQGVLIILAGYIESTTGLPTVQTNVKAGPAIESSAFMHPDSVQFMQSGQDLEVLISPQTLQINTGGQADADLIAFAKSWNTKTSQEQPDSGMPAAQPEESSPGLWTRYISQPLGNALAKYFGDAAKSDAGMASGSSGVFYFALSGPPPAGEEVVVNFGRESGDRSISLVVGERFVFTAEDWNRPRMAVIQLDPKLMTASSAQFSARAGNIPLAWSLTFATLFGLFMLFFIYHRFALPYPESDKAGQTAGLNALLRDFWLTFASFFKKEHIWATIAFLLLFRFAEAQLVKLAAPFMLDAQEAGGLGLTTGDVGFVYGTVGILALTIGGLLGGFLAARHGLKYWLWWMVIAINLPNATYIFLSQALPESFFVVNAAVAIEQFGYGFGFTAYMLYMIYAAEGEHKTAHFALCTGFMALGMMLPGMFSGWLQEIIGYQHFFIWVLLATIPGFLVTALIPLDPEFGKKTENGS